MRLYGGSAACPSLSAAAASPGRRHIARLFPSPENINISYEDSSLSKREGGQGDGQVMSWLVLLVAAGLARLRAAPALQEVKVGQDETGVLECGLNNTASTPASWLRAESLQILTSGWSVYSPDPRYSVSRAATAHWRLVIARVEKQDSGLYLCQTGEHQHQVSLVIVPRPDPPPALDLQHDAPLPPTPHFTGREELERGLGRLLARPNPPPAQPAPLLDGLLVPLACLVSLATLLLLLGLVRTLLQQERGAGGALQHRARPRHS